MVLSVQDSDKDDSLTGSEMKENPKVLSLNQIINLYSSGMDTDFEAA